MGSRREVTTYRCTGTNCQIVGYRPFRLVMISMLGHGAGNSKVTSQISVDQWGAPVGTNINGTMSVEMRCKHATSTAENLCVPTSERIIAMPVSNWVGNGGAVYGVTFDLTSYPGQGPDLTNFHELELWNGIIGTGRDFPPLEGPNEQIRCNNLVYGVPEGCIIFTVQSIFHVKKSETPESAEHIRLACYSPGQPAEIIEYQDYVEVRGGTVPLKVGARIAGQRDCNTSGLPLTRNYRNTILRDASRRKAQQACVEFWGPNYPNQKGETGNWDCDEFPFNSTYQASAAAPHNTTASWWSARVIHKADNQLLGSQLSAWYGADHILHEDPFYVVIDN